jgi:hypothetical protein
MNEVILWMLLTVFVAGGVGGVVNAAMSDNGFLLPTREKTAGDATLLRPGYLGNVLVGAVAAVVSWGLYGPLSAHAFIGTPQALAASASLDKAGLTLASFVGALLVGAGGARWLSNEVDKNLLRAAATDAASAKASEAASRQIAMASPAQALSIVRTLQKAA